MNLMHLISNQDPIGGIMIGDSKVRACFAAPEQFNKLNAPLICVEESLPNNTVVNGVVQNVDELAKALASAIKSSNTRYFIVSISPAVIYSKALSFPKSVGDDQLEEAISVAVKFQLPFEPKTAYVDTETIRDERGRVTNAIAARSSVVDAYLSALEKAGINTVAMESYATSAARVILVPPETYTVAIPCETSTAIAVIKSSHVQFMRSVPQGQLAEPNAIIEEIRKVHDAYIAEYGIDTKSLNWQESQPEPSYAKIFPSDKPPHDWYAAIGAYLRGMLPREFDTIASVMPLNTSEAYEQQKAMAFAGFVRNIVVSVSLFFVVVYAAFFGFTHALMANEQANEHVAANPTVVGVQEMQSNAEKFGNLLNTAADLAHQDPSWSILIDDILSLSRDGIVISTAGISVPTSPVQISGIASTRDGLNNFKTILETSGIFNTVTLPLTNLEVKDNIPYSISFMITDPKHVFPN